MNKKLFSILIVCLFLINTQVLALSPNEVKLRGVVCTEEGKKTELALAKEDGTLETKTCFDTYENAKKEMDSLKDEEGFTYVIIEDGIIIDAKYALIDYDQTSDTKYTNVYSDKTLKTRTTYIKTTASTSDDAVLLELDYNTKRIKIKVNDMIGWIQKYEYESSKTNILYDIVPLSWVESANYYEIKENKIIHQFPRNVYGNKSIYPLTIGPKPEMLEDGIYYSYDGHYFYKDLKTLIQDYKNNTYDSSVNKDAVYYNYYQYLSFRTKTSYNADNINQFLDKYGVKSSSKLYKTGEIFVKYQDKYGINAALMLAIGINESGWGTSNIAQTKNNLFGLNAVDQTPGESANYYKSVEDCIHDYSYVWLDYGYGRPGDKRFKGANLGTKGEGANVHYASDVYWGEIAASYYYQLDESFDFQDYNSYQIGVLKEEQNDKVYAYKKVNQDRISSDYQYKVKSSPIVVLDSITEEATGKVWYKIMSDATLDENLNVIGNSKSNPRIEYNATQNQVYVEASYFLLVNKKVEDAPSEEWEEVKPGETPNPTPDETPNASPSPTPTPVPTPTPIPDTPVEDIVKEAGFEAKDGYLLKIANGLTKEDLVKKLSIHKAIVKLEGEKLLTGQKLTITSGKLEETLTIIVYGDTNGDGAISAVDYVKIKNHIMATAKLEGAFLKAADVNKDLNISAVDYVKIKNYIMGDKSSIE